MFQVYSHKYKIVRSKVLGGHFTSESCYFGNGYCNKSIVVRVMCSRLAETRDISVIFKKKAQFYCQSNIWTRQLLLVGAFISRGLQKDSLAFKSAELMLSDRINVTTGDRLVRLLQILNHFFNGDHIRWTFQIFVIRFQNLSTLF